VCLSTGHCWHPAQGEFWLHKSVACITGYLIIWSSQARCQVPNLLPHIFLISRRFALVQYISILGNELRMLWTAELWVPLSCHSNVFTCFRGRLVENVADSSPNEVMRTSRSTALLGRLGFKNWVLTKGKYIESYISFTCLLSFVLTRHYKYFRWITFLKTNSPGKIIKIISKRDGEQYEF
jgi:hypothetical protein